MILYDFHTHHCDNQESSIISCCNREIYSGSYIEKDQSPNTVFSAGIHPWDSKEVSNSLLYQLEQLIIQKAIQAVGECGLDRLRGDSIEQQEALFAAHIRIAETYQLPLIVHCVKAFDRLIPILQSNRATNIPIIIHAFRGNHQLTAQLLRLSNIYFSIDYRVNPQSLLLIPLERLCIESDEYPNTLEHSYHTIATQLSISLTELQIQMQTNFEELFKK